MRFAARTAGQQQFEPFSYVPPLLSEHDVRGTVTHPRVCHTGIQAMDDYYGITPFSFTPGHEIVGYISEVGCEDRKLT
jgi:D-arabinose 1-dehydrogenase-like Zn-dependent alcohol dehydrogenase